MKKIMIALAVVASAVTLNASQYMWGLFSGDYTDVNGDAFESGTAFLYVLTGESAVPQFVDGAWDLQGATLVTSGDFDGDNWGWGNPDWDASADVVAGATPGVAQQYYALVITDSVTGDLASYVGEGKYAQVITGQGEQEVYSATDPIEYGTNFINYDSAITQAGWTELSSEVVPEPTSGLLMLIGMAGLALRRRRA